jgi:hypothetical protein
VNRNVRCGHASIRDTITSLRSNLQDMIFLDSRSLNSVQVLHFLSTQSRPYCRIYSDRLSKTPQLGRLDTHCDGYLQANLNRIERDSGNGNPEDLISGVISSNSGRCSPRSADSIPLRENYTTFQLIGASFLLRRLH